MVIVLCLWPVFCPAGVAEAQEAVGHDRLGTISASVTPWALALGAAVPVLLVIILLEWRSVRWAKTFQELYRTFADDRQREREAYIRFVIAQTKLTGGERTLEQAEAAATELVKALEQARAEIATLAGRLQQR